MENPTFTFIFLPLLILIIYWVTNTIRNKLAKPNHTKNVQTPGKFDHFLLKLLTFIAILSAIFMIIGLFIRETEMTIAFLVLTLVFLGIVWFLKSKYDISYQEDSESFLLKTKKKEVQVFYKDIIDWQPGFNEIKILDETKPNNEYIRVNIAMLSPKILLRKIVEMTFEGKFYRAEDDYSEDPTRQYEIVNFLTSNNYGDLVEDYMDQIEK